MHSQIGGYQRGRLIGATALLAMSVGLGAIIAVQSIAGARRHQATIETTLKDFAGLAAFNLAAQVSRQLSDAAAQTLAFWSPPHPPPLPAGTKCPGGNTYFTEHDDGALDFGGAAPMPEEVAFIRDSLVRNGNGMRLLDQGHWRLRFVRGDGSRTDGYFIFRREGLVGFSVCFRDGVLSDSVSIFRHIMLSERALPAALTGDMRPDSMFSMTITSGTATLYASPGARPSPYSGTALVGPDQFGDLSVRIDMLPGLASGLIVGGMVQSRAPATVSLLTLSAILVVTALLQLRREYRLIAARSAFVASVSHELRTPLSQILLFTELLKLGRLRSDAEQARALDIVDQETRRLIRLVENILRFSGAGVSPGITHLEVVDLETHVRDTIEAFRPLAEARGVRVQSRISPLTAVRADRSGLRQVLLNLLDNAVKYGPRGQAVLVEANSANGHTRITVSDQGPGIPAPERNRIWDAHYRLQRDAQSVVAGSGIGLAVVRALADEMNGKSWVEETETGGARFVVELPAARISVG